MVGMLVVVAVTVRGHVPSWTTAGSGSGQQTPTPSRSASSQQADPSRPGALNTGVPAGTRLTVIEGDQVYTRNGQVITNVDIHGFVRIRAKHVVIKNAVVRGGAPKCNSAVIFVETGASATIQDTEIAPLNRSACLDGVWASDTTLLRLNIHDTVDGVKAFDNTTLADSWIHDLSWFDRDPNQSDQPTSNDAVQTYDGNRHVTLRHNTLDATGQGGSAYQVTQDGGDIATDLRIEDNWLNAGGCALVFSHRGGPTPMTGIMVTGNRFVRGSAGQCAILISSETILTQDTGNVWDDTGQPIPPPRRD